MFQAMMIVLREGVEAFLIVAITLAFLRKTEQHHLIHAVFLGIVASIFTSGLLGYWLWTNQGANLPLWEGVLGLATVILVGSLIVHMWQAGPQLRKELEGNLSKATSAPELHVSFFNVFIFTVFMISREGMETVLLLFQISGNPQFVTGMVLGLVGAIGIAYLWQQFGYLINMKHFFQVTAVYLLLFTLQIAVQAFHEFTEAGIFPNSEALHIASEPFSTEGIYGKWYATLTFAGCAIWLLTSWVSEQWAKRRLASSLRQQTTKA